MEKNKSMMVVIILLLVVLLGTIVGLALYVIGRVNTGGEELAEATIPPVVTVPVEKIEVLNLGLISTNLMTGTDGKRHLIKTNVSVGVNLSDETTGREFFTLFSSKTEIIRDIFNAVLWNSTLEDINAENGITSIKEEILTLLREKFQTSLIYEIYLDDIITQ